MKMACSKDKYMCANLYECNMAARFTSAQTINVSLGRCGVCDSATPNLIQAVFALDYVQACTICCEMQGKLQNFNIVMQNCREQRFCPYCNCEYIPLIEEKHANGIDSIKAKPDNVAERSIPERHSSPRNPTEIGKGDSKAEVKEMAAFLKIFVGDRCLEDMQNDIRKLIIGESEVKNGCEGICELLHKIIHRMEDNKKKESFKRKVNRVLREVNLLPKSKCFETL